jgi:hypothetical protein
MAVQFDKQKQIRSLPILLEVDRQAKLNEAAGPNGWIQRASYMLNDVAQAYLLGQGQQANDVLEKALAWMSRALRDSSLKNPVIRAKGHREVGLANWFGSGEIDRSAFSESCAELESGAGRQDVDEMDLEWYCGSCVLASKEPQIEVPRANSNSPVSYAGLASAEKTKVGKDSGLLEVAAAQMLKKNVPKWLASGGYLEIAFWALVTSTGPDRPAPEVRLASVLELIV